MPAVAATIALGSTSYADRAKKGASSQKRTPNNVRRSSSTTATPTQSNPNPPFKNSDAITASAHTDPMSSAVSSSSSSVSSSSASTSTTSTTPTLATTSGGMSISTTPSSSVAMLTRPASPSSPGNGTITKLESQKQQQKSPPTSVMNVWDRRKEAMAARLSAAATMKPAVREEPHVEAEPAQEHDPFVVRFPSSRPPPAERANGAVDGAIWPEVGSAINPRRSNPPSLPHQHSYSHSSSSHSPSPSPLPMSPIPSLISPVKPSLRHISNSTSNVSNPSSPKAAGPSSLPLSPPDEGTGVSSYHPLPSAVPNTNNNTNSNTTSPANKSKSRFDTKIQNDTANTNTTPANTKNTLGPAEQRREEKVDMYHPLPHNQKENRDEDSEELRQQQQNTTTNMTTQNEQNLHALNGSISASGSRVTSPGPGSNPIPPPPMLNSYNGNVHAEPIPVLGPIPLSAPTEQPSSLPPPSDLDAEYPSAQHQSQSQSQNQQEGGGSLVQGYPFPLPPHPLAHPLHPHQQQQPEHEWYQQQQAQWSGYALPPAPPPNPMYYYPPAHAAQGYWYPAYQEQEQEHARQFVEYGNEYGGGGGGGEADGMAEGRTAKVVFGTIGAGGSRSCTPLPLDEERKQKGEERGDGGVKGIKFAIGVTPGQRIGKEGGDVREVIDLTVEDLSLGERVEGSARARNEKEKWEFGTTSTSSSISPSPSPAPAPVPLPIPPTLGWHTAQDIHIHVNNFSHPPQHPHPRPHPREQDDLPPPPTQFYTPIDAPAPPSMDMGGMHNPNLNINMMNMGNLGGGMMMGLAVPSPLMMPGPMVGVGDAAGTGMEAPYSARGSPVPYGNSNGNGNVGQVEGNPNGNFGHGDEWEVKDYGYGFGRGHWYGARRGELERERERMGVDMTSLGMAGPPLPMRPRRGSYNGSGNSPVNGYPPSSYERGYPSGRRGRGFGGRGFNNGGRFRGGFQARHNQHHQHHQHQQAGYDDMPPPQDGYYGGYAGTYDYAAGAQGAPQVAPPVPTPVSNIPFPLDPTRWYLLGQLEYYLSPQNMAQDFFLRQQMDSQGWIPISLIASFNRVKRLMMDVQLVRDVLVLSEQVQVRDNWVRMNAWEQFVLPDAPRSTVGLSMPITMTSLDDDQREDKGELDAEEMDGDEDEEEDVVFVMGR